MTWIKTNPSSSTPSPQPEYVKPLRLLMIGNSFTVDATEWLFNIVESLELDVIIGVAYDSGQSLEGSYGKLINDEGITSYNKYTKSGGVTKQPGALLKNILTDHDWDVVTFQQVSGSSTDYTTFQPHLTNLKNEVISLTGDDTIRFGLHMTWAYSYGADMYEGIVNTYKNAMKEMEFDLLIPNGTTIQNARTDEELSNIGTKLTRDGHHLDEGIGRYLAALTVFESVLVPYYNNINIDSIDFYPNINGANPYLGFLSKVAARNAIINPFKITSI